SSPPITPSTVSDLSLVRVENPGGSVADESLVDVELPVDSGRTTHIKSTKELVKLHITKRENKGKDQIRITYELAPPE
ncbi:MAG: hypothetical protein ACFFDP_13505, partial [Promethearchaeota archaeon]